MNTHSYNLTLSLRYMFRCMGCVLLTSSQPQYEMKGTLLLDVVVGEGTAVFKLLSSKDETLLVGGDAFLVLDLGFHVLDGVTGLDLECDGLSGQGFDEDLHPSSQPEYEMKGAFFLDVVVGQGAAIL